MQQIAVLQQPVLGDVALVVEGLDVERVDAVAASEVFTLEAGGGQVVVTLVLGNL